MLTVEAYALDTPGWWHWVISTPTHDAVLSAERKLPTRAAAKRAALRALARWTAAPDAHRTLCAGWTKWHVDGAENEAGIRELEALAQRDGEAAKGAALVEGVL